MSDGENTDSNKNSKTNKYSGGGTPSIQPLSRIDLPPEFYFNMSKDAYYFPHDSNAQRDPKLAALLKNFGYKGYGIWWCLIEIMHEQKDGKLEKFPKLYEGLAQTLGIDEAEMKQIISASINDFRLLKEDSKYIWSDRVARNLQNRIDKRLQKAEAGRLGGIASGRKRSKTKQDEATLEANEPKESKVKERKERAAHALTPPSLKDITDYINENHYAVDPQTFYKFFTESGWVDSEGKKVISWKQKIITWASHNKNKENNNIQGGFHKP